MKTKRNIKQLLFVFVLLFVMLSLSTVYNVSTYGTRWFSSPYNNRILSQKSNVIAGKICDRNGKVIVYSETSDSRSYTDNKSVRLSTAHTVGDSYGQTLGADAFFSKYLLGFDQDIISMVGGALNGKSRYGDDITLTIDSELSSYIYDETGDHNCAVVVMNYKTGEILASVSRPTFDPATMGDYLKGDIELKDGAMVNRVTMGRYTPGSTFKIVTLLAAIRYLDNAEDITFDCNGALYYDSKTGAYIEKGGENKAKDSVSLLKDYQGTQHGSLTLKQAFAKSCNTSFAKLAMKIGADKLKNTAASLGLDSEFLFSDFVAYSGKYQIGSRDIDIAWSGAGQYKDIMTPLNMCMISACVANEGNMLEPKLLRSVSSAAGIQKYYFESNVYKKSMTASEASILKEYMTEVVEHGTGSAAKISGYTVAGKTGTAEVADNKSVASHAWFTGFIDSKNHPLAVCVIVEHSGSGGKIAAPIACKALKKAIKLGY